MCIREFSERVKEKRVDPVQEERGGGSSHSRESEGTQENQGNRGGEREFGGVEGGCSEDGGLVLGADGAFGIFGVQQPGGAAALRWSFVHIH